MPGVTPVTPVAVTVDDLPRPVPSRPVPSRPVPSHLAAARMRTVATGQFSPLTPSRAAATAPGRDEQLRASRTIAADAAKITPTAGLSRLIIAAINPAELGDRLAAGPPRRTRRARDTG